MEELTELTEPPDRYCIAREVKRVLDLPGERKRELWEEISDVIRDRHLKTPYWIEHMGDQRTVLDLAHDRSFFEEAGMPYKDGGDWDGIRAGIAMFYLNQLASG